LFVPLTSLISFLVGSTFFEKKSNRVGMGIGLVFLLLLLLIVLVVLVKKHNKSKVGINIESSTCASRSEKSCLHFVNSPLPHREKKIAKK